MWQVFECAHVGVAGTTKVVQTARGKIRDIFEARVGIAIMGVTANPKTNEESDPFSSSFRDNYARGFGTTEEEALEALREDIKTTTDALWGLY